MIRQTIAAAMLVAMVGAGCSFSPVYSDGSPINAMSLAFDLGEPETRVEQIIYQEMALRFAVSSAPRTPKLDITATSATRGSRFLTPGTPGIGGTNRGQDQVTVRATATATYNGEEIFTATRTATAEYSTSGQVLADQSAAIDAEERAAKAAAESLRLAILATFPNSQSYLTP